jgi:hypothetical protein
LKQGFGRHFQVLVWVDYGLFQQRLAFERSKFLVVEGMMMKEAGDGPTTEVIIASQLKVEAPLHAACLGISK